MTTIKDVHPSAASELLAAKQRTRLIAVGVRDADHDATTIEWAVADAAIDGDIVHVVQAYTAIGLPGCVWDPVLRARDARRAASKHRAALAVQRAQHLDPDLQVGVSVIAGGPSEVLEQMSDVVDLVVIGDDSAAPGPAGKIAWRIQDAARGPVVCVPPGHRITAGLPVTLVADDRGLCEQVVEFAARAASRYGVALQVSRAWSSLHRPASPEFLAVAEQQEMLDLELSDVAKRHSSLGVIGRIELAENWLTELSGQSSVIVAGTRSASAVRSVAARPLGCPTVIVPDWE